MKKPLDLRRRRVSGKSLTRPSVSPSSTRPRVPEIVRFMADTASLACRSSSKRTSGLRVSASRIASRSPGCSRSKKTRGENLLEYSAEQRNLSDEQEITQRSGIGNGDHAAEYLSTSPAAGCFEHRSLAIQVLNRDVGQWDLVTRQNLVRFKSR
jgi:hypothetical protein